MLFTIKRKDSSRCTAKQKNQLLLFEVIDNGDGFDTENTKQKNDHFSGIGISHVDERIRLMYGDAYGLTIQSVIGTGTTVTICLPLLPKKSIRISKIKNSQALIFLF